LIIIIIIIDNKHKHKQFSLRPSGTTLSTPNKISFSFSNRFNLISSIVIAADKYSMIFLHMLLQIKMILIGIVTEMTLIRSDIFM